MSLVVCCGAGAVFEHGGVRSSAAWPGGSVASVENWWREIEVGFAAAVGVAGAVRGCAVENGRRGCVEALILFDLFLIEDLDVIGVWCDWEGVVVGLECFEADLGLKWLRFIFEGNMLVQRGGLLVIGYKLYRWMGDIWVGGGLKWDWVRLWDVKGSKVWRIGESRTTHLGCYLRL